MYAGGTPYAYGPGTLLEAAELRDARIVELEANSGPLDVKAAAVAVELSEGLVAVNAGGI